MSTNGTCCMTDAGYGSGGGVITLSEEQLAQLKARDADAFVAAVCDQYLSASGTTPSNARRLKVQAMMQAAYDYALRCGFTSTPHIVHLMYFAVDAPGVLQEPAVRMQLEKPGATPEQRFDDLLAVVALELTRLEERK